MNFEREFFQTLLITNNYLDVALYEVILKLLHELRHVIIIFISEQMSEFF